MLHKFLVIISLFISCIVSYASDIVSYASDIEESNLIPKTPREERLDSVGSIMSGKNEDGLVLFFSDRSNSQVRAIDQFLWQASLDAVSNMPVKVSDKSSGVISTDWYESSPSERTKINIIMKPSSSLKVVVFKQIIKEGEWKTVNTNNAKLAQEMQEKIVARAAELKDKY